MTDRSYVFVTIAFSRWVVFSLVISHALDDIGRCWHIDLVLLTEEQRPLPLVPPQYDTIANAPILRLAGLTDTLRYNDIC